MSARGRFTFGQYVLRPADEEDLLLASMWTAADPDHAQFVNGEFWLEQSMGRDSYLLLDQQGPLFFFKMHLYEFKAKKEVELHIQFPPGCYREDMRTEHRVTMGLMRGMKWLETMLRNSSVDEIYFDSASPKLIAFCVRRLEFILEGNRLRKQLQASMEEEMVMEKV